MDKTVETILTDVSGIYAAISQAYEKSDIRALEIAVQRLTFRYGPSFEMKKHVFAQFLQQITELYLPPLEDYFFSTANENTGLFSKDKRHVSSLGTTIRFGFLWTTLPAKWACFLEDSKSNAEEFYDKLMGNVIVYEKDLTLIKSLQADFVAIHKQLQQKIDTLMVSAQEFAKCATEMGKFFVSNFVAKVSPTFVGSLAHNLLRSCVKVDIKDTPTAGFPYYKSAHSLHRRAAMQCNNIKLLE